MNVRFPLSPSVAQAQVEAGQNQEGTRHRGSQGRACVPPNGPSIRLHVSCTEEVLCGTPWISGFSFRVRSFSKRNVSINPDEYRLKAFPALRSTPPWKTLPKSLRAQNFRCGGPPKSGGPNSYLDERQRRIRICRRLEDGGATFIPSTVHFSRASSHITHGCGKSVGNSPRCVGSPLAYRQVYMLLLWYSV